MLISDQARDFEIVFKAALYVSFSKLLVYIWDVE